MGQEQTIIFGEEAANLLKKMKDVAGNKALDNILIKNKMIKVIEEQLNDSSIVVDDFDIMPDGTIELFFTEVD